MNAMEMSVCYTERSLVSTCSMLGLLCLVTVIVSARSASAPFITPCRSNDAACAAASGQAAVPAFVRGVPELGIKPLDPLKLAFIKGDQAGLQLTFRDTVVTGLKDSVVENIKVDNDKGKMIVIARCSPVLRGDYTLGGRLLVLPIQGVGKYTINIQDIVIKADSDVEIVQGDDGKPHWHITKTLQSFQVKTGAQFHFENLFNGNKILAAPVRGFLNVNWRDVMREIAPPIVRAVVQEVVNDVKALFKAVPIEELQIA